MFFLDEIHRFNKAQQDALLPAVEEGLVTLIGATTENPAFEVNGALLSRMRVYALTALTAQEVGEVLRRALASRELDGAALAPGEPSAQGADEADGESDDTKEAQRGAEDGSGGGGAPIAVEPAALDFLAMRSEGDARTALNALELAVETAAELGKRCVGIARAEDALQRRAVLYDRKGDRHYDYISAWIKATRGSDPDASLYYLAVMLEGGEDPRFIVRRMVILASEDVGNADPAALGVAVAAAQAVEHVGMPEANSRSRRPRSTCRWRRSQTRRAGRWRQRSATCASTARRRSQAGCARVPARARRSAATTTRTRTPGTSPHRSWPRRVRWASASTSPTRPRRSWRAAWRRCAGPEGARVRPSGRR